MKKWFVSLMAGTVLASVIMIIPAPTATVSAATSATPGVQNTTIIVKSGEVFDGKGQRYIAGSALGDGSQKEGQKPIFRIENGGAIKNVVIGAPAADGIHTYGNATLQNIVWEDIGEDALTIKESGNVTLDGGSATNGDDKMFQINAPSTFTVKNFKGSNAGKFIRQVGGSTFKVNVIIDRCDISNMKESIFRTDSSISTVKMTNTRYHNIPTKFRGVNTANITESGNVQY
ncbi:pectate lyase [Paenibacillus sp. JQZ6Y-1]